jgi:hypothetical protein
MNSLSQNIIAVNWDFDKTLVPSYMQVPLFKKFNIDEERFWSETMKLNELYEARGIKTNPDTLYLNHLLSYVNKGVCKGLNNAMLRELGKELLFFEGLPDFLRITKDLIQNNNEFARFDIKVEHYIVSTGLVEMIRGSKINPYVDGIWGCEFIEEPFISIDGNLLLDPDASSQISGIAYTIDNTTKTRALFEINKGVNKIDEINVNQQMDDDDRRVPFRNMIYIADGPSDVPAFSVVQKNGGKTFAVYDKSSIDSFRQVKRLQEDGRVDMFGEADYRQGTQTFLWITEQVNDIAENIVKLRKEKLLKGKNGIPRHLGSVNTDGI